MFGVIGSLLLTVDLVLLFLAAYDIAVPTNWGPYGFALILAAGIGTLFLAIQSDRD